MIAVQLSTACAEPAAVSLHVPLPSQWALLPSVLRAEVAIRTAEGAVVAAAGAEIREGGASVRLGALPVGVELAANVAWVHESGAVVARGSAPLSVTLVAGGSQNVAISKDHYVYPDDDGDGANNYWELSLPAGDAPNGVFDPHAVPAGFFDGVVGVAFPPGVARDVEIMGRSIGVLTTLGVALDGGASETGTQIVMADAGLQRLTPEVRVRWLSCEESSPTLFRVVDDLTFTCCGQYFITLYPVDSTHESEVRTRLAGVCDGVWTNGAADAIYVWHAQAQRMSKLYRRRWGSGYRVAGEFDLAQGLSEDLAPPAFGENFSGVPQIVSALPREDGVILLDAALGGLRVFADSGEDLGAALAGRLLDPVAMAYQESTQRLFVSLKSDGLVRVIDLSSEFHSQWKELDPISINADGEWVSQTALAFDSDPIRDAWLYGASSRGVVRVDSLTRAVEWVYLRDAGLQPMGGTVLSVAGGRAVALWPSASSLLFLGVPQRQHREREPNGALAPEKRAQGGNLVDIPFSRVVGWGDTVVSESGEGDGGDSASFGQVGKVEDDRVPGDLWRLSLGGIAAERAQSADITVIVALLPAGGAGVLQVGRELPLQESPFQVMDEVRLRAPFGGNVPGEGSAGLSTGAFLVTQIESSGETGASEALTELNAGGEYWVSVAGVGAGMPYELVVKSDVLPVEAEREPNHGHFETWPETELGTIRGRVGGTMRLSEYGSDVVDDEDCFVVWHRPRTAVRLDATGGGTVCLVVRDTQGGRLDYGRRACAQAGEPAFRFADVLKSWYGAVSFCVEPGEPGEGSAGADDHGGSNYELTVVSLARGG